MLIVNVLALSMIVALFVVSSVLCVVLVNKYISKRIQKVTYSVEERLTGIDYYPNKERAIMWEDLRKELGFVSVASMLAAYDH